MSSEGAKGIGDIRYSCRASCACCSLQRTKASFCGLAHKVYPKAPGAAIPDPILGPHLGRSRSAGEMRSAVVDN